MFNKNNLVLQSSTGTPNTPKIWVYHSDDLDTDIISVDYFLTANDILSKNDMIFVVADVSGTPVHKIVIVNEVTDLTVDVTDGTTISAVDNS
jgi:hypothetical protein